MVIFALAETLLAPTLPAIINDLAPDGAAGRYSGLGALAYTTGFLLGPISGAAALGAGQDTGLFAALVLACAAAAVAALRLGRHPANFALGPPDGPASRSVAEHHPPEYSVAADLSGRCGPADGHRWRAR
jgi:MFS family permease